jgi:quercetin dioxygenase-like cupin family protein
MGAIKRHLVIIFTLVLVFSGTTSFSKESEDHVNAVRNLPTRNDLETGMQVARIAEDLMQLEVFVAKLGPNGKSKAQKHIYEKLIYVIEGRGHTLIWRNDKSEPYRLEWEAGDLFSTPVNFRHQHYNESSTDDAALFHVTTKPLIDIVLGDKLGKNVEYADESIWEEYLPIKDPVPTGNKTEAYVEMKGGFIVKNIDDMKLPFNRPGHFGIAFLPFAGRNMAGNHLFELQIFDLEPPTESPYNSHPWEVVYYVLNGDGGGLFHMEGEPPEYLTFKEGDVFFERSNKWHWHAPVNGSKYRIIQIKASAWFRDTMGVEPIYLDKPSSFQEFFDQVRSRM